MPHIETVGRLDGLVVVGERRWTGSLARALAMLAERGMIVAIADDSGDGQLVVAGVSSHASADRALERLARCGVHRANTAVVDETIDDSGLRRLLAGQLWRRRRRELITADGDPLWCIVFDGFEPGMERVREALMALADGRVGTAGATLAEHPGQRRWTVAIGVYDGDGPDTHLLSGPVSFHLPYQIDRGAVLRRVLDLRIGVLWEHEVGDAGPFQAVRFTSVARPGISAMRVRCPDARAGPLLRPSTDGHITEEGVDDGIAWMSVLGTPQESSGLVAAAHEVRLSTGDGTVADRVVAYEADGDRPPRRDVAVGRAREAAAIGFDRLVAEHREAWTSRWHDADICVEGDDELQLATRFALFHLMASVPEDGEAAVGARGLTGEGYRGHVFWDADTFTLPFLAATRPAAARAMLEYRIRRLAAAQAIARAGGRSGARFPWESARSGYDVTPRAARDRTGQLVPIRTGLIEEHIVAQVAWASCFYSDWTGDDEFTRGPGLRLLVETARYWRSRVRMAKDGSAHIYGVIGPDEYHETVDDNAFTNVMARWNLRRAADAVEAAPTGAKDVDADEVARWRQAADALVDWFDPETGVYEQFEGFHRLESMIISEVAPRRPIAADLLLGARRVREAQVLKQADVLMLHHLLPDEVEPGTLEANLRFYEPRTAHGSSLSPSIHASLFARAGDFDSALDALRIAARIDLDDLTGTTAAGLHIATMGGLWQAFAFGFAGLRAHSDGLHVDPHHPPAWEALEVRVRYRGSRVRVRTEPSLLTIHADPTVTVVVDSEPYEVGPSGVRCVPRGPGWELVT